MRSRHRHDILPLICRYIPSLCNTPRSSSVSSATGTSNVTCQLAFSVQVGWEDGLKSTDDSSGANVKF